MIETIFNWTFHNIYTAFASLFIFFNILYWSGTLIISAVFGYLEKNKVIAKVDNHAMHRGQQKKEIWQSMRSIFIFSLQGMIIQQGLVHNWFQISQEFNWWFIPQVLILFLWNEIHFYSVHVLLHTRFMMKRVHWVHHFSKEPTVFSTFSFHWLEAFLLGTVILFPLFFYPFQFLAILSLPILSWAINLLGHCNYDLFSSRNPAHLLRFSYRHSMHHKRGKRNFGFLLPWLDQLFKTNEINE